MEEKFDVAVVTQLRAEMAAANMNTVGLAEAVGVPPGSLYRYWNGSRSMRMDLLVRLLDALNVDMVTFFDRAVSRAREQ